jgi:hypothetical protein
MNKCKLLKNKTNIIDKYSHDFKEKANLWTQMHIQNESQMWETNTSKEELKIRKNSKNLMVESKNRVNKSREKSTSSNNNKNKRESKINKKSNIHMIKRAKPSLQFLEDFKEKDIFTNSLTSSNSFSEKINVNDKEEMSGENSGDPETDEMQEQPLKKKKTKLVALKNNDSNNKKPVFDQNMINKMKMEKENELKSESYALMNVASIPYLDKKIKFKNVFLEVFIEKPKTMDNVQIMLQEMWQQLSESVEV